jgi:hypothetical protein
MGTSLAATGLGHGADAPLVEETRLLPPLVLAGSRLVASSSPQGSPEFTPRKGSMWVLAHVVAVVEGAALNAEAVFEVTLAGLPMSPTDTVMFVKARRMRAPVAAVWPRDEQGKPKAPMTRRPVDWKGKPADLAALEAGLMGEVDLRQVAVLHTIDVRQSDATGLTVALKRASGLRPLLMELQAGQGPLPRELAAFAEQANGPWLWRHRYEAAMIGSGVALGGLALWRLRR